MNCGDYKIIDITDNAKCILTCQLEKHHKGKHQSLTTWSDSQ